MDQAPDCPSEMDKPLRTQPARRPTRAPGVPVQVRATPNRAGAAASGSNVRAAALVALGLVLAGPATAAERIAIFPFELINTSMEPTRPDEENRLELIGALARETFQGFDRFEVVNVAPAADEIARLEPLRGCNGCELRLAGDLGADYAALGWVQKVSNLILNINLQVRAVATGQLVAAGTVDIRGNTDESWRRGIAYLLEHRILPQP